MKNDIKLTWFFIYWVTYSSLISRYLFNNIIISFIPDILIFIIFLRTLKYKRKDIKFFKNSLIQIPLIILFTTSIISSLYNFVPIATFLWGVRMLLRYIIAIIVIVKLFNIDEVNKYRKFIYTWFNINFFFCVIQFLQGDRIDLMGGTFPGNTLLVPMLFISASLFSIDYFNGKIRLTSYIIKLLIFLLISIWAELKISYFIIPPIGFISYVIAKKISIKHFILGIFLYLFLVPILQFSLSFYYSEDYVHNTFDKESILKEASSSYGFRGGFNRNTAITMTDDLILKDNTHKMLGYGLGVGTQSSFFSTDFYKNWGWTSYFNFSTSYVLCELGWLGFVSFIFIYIIMGRVFYKYIYSKNLLVKQWAQIGLLSVFISLVLFWYNDTAYFNFYLVIILWGICISAITSQGKRKENIAK